MLRPNCSKCSLKVSIITAILDCSSGSGPLSHNAAGIMAVVAINGSIIDTFSNQPVAAGSIVLISDDSSGKTVRVSTSDLSADKSTVYQFAQIFLRLIHTNDSASTNSDCLRFVI